MKCKQLETLTLDYLDGKLASRQAEAVEQHLAGCPACAERLRGFATVSSLLEGWEPMRPSALFNARLERRILAEADSPGGWRERLRLWLLVYPWRKSALAASLLGMLLLAVAVSRNFTASLDTAPMEVSGFPAVSEAEESYDELALYRELPVLENLELLSNFEVLQELQTTAQ